MEHINIFPNTLFVNIFYIKIKDNYYTKLISFFLFYRDSYKNKLYVVQFTSTLNFTTVKK